MTKPTKLSLALIAHLEACGYQVTKRKSKRTKERPALNCLGKPMSASFDPNWKRKTQPTSIARLRVPYGDAMKWVQS
jgi:hypothetical protein